MTAVVLWPLRYGPRGLATTWAAPVVVVLIADGVTWELCTAAMTGADNDSADWRPTA